jgi:POT family proton-dependent oligopeptide transporter
MSDADAGSYSFMFYAGCYLMPLAGGFVADNFLGKYNTIVLFSIPYIVGQVMIGIESTPFLFISMALLAMGSGVIKPNISTLMGLTYDQQRPGQEELRTTAFSLFYMSINIGAALSQLGIPWIRTNYSYQTAFLFPAGLMAVAFVIFAAGKRFYAKEVIARTQPTPEERALRWQVLGRIGGLFLLVTFFWAAFDQSAATWIIFGRMYQDTSLFGFHVDVEQVQATNPILIVVLTPLFASLWAILRNRGIAVRATDKIITGFLLTSLCLCIMAYAAYNAGPIETIDGQQMVRPENKVTIWWQVLAFFILTIAEILISITGLELAFVAAPKSMKSFVTSLWLLTVFLANVINTQLAWIYPSMNPGTYFAMLAGFLVLVAIAFFFIAQRFNRLMREQAIAENPALKVSFSEEPGGPLVTPEVNEGIIDKARREGITDKDPPSQ